MGVAPKRVPIRGGVWAWLLSPSQSEAGSGAWLRKDVPIRGWAVGVVGSGSGEKGRGYGAWSRSAARKRAGLVGVATFPVTWCG